MTLETLLKPGGDPWKILPWMLAVSFVGGSGPLVVSLQYADYPWAMGVVSFNAYTPLFILGFAWAIWRLVGARISTAWALAAAVVGGCFVAQAFALWLSELLLGQDAKAIGIPVAEHNSSFAADHDGPVLRQLLASHQFAAWQLSAVVPSHGDRGQRAAFRELGAHDAPLGG